MSKVYYVCQRAAQAIIAEIGPLRVSSDALQAVNLFIDEFISLLIISACSLDLAHLKSAVVTLLPLSLGKNALVEAKIELKNQINSDDYDLWKMQPLEADSSEKVIPLIQETCALYCTLADDSHNIDLFNNSVEIDGIVIAPVVIIYITTVIEHMAEYLLNSIAVTADQTDAEHIRVKEVLLTLLDDPQLSSLFRRMNLKEKLEKRASTYNFTAPLPSPAPSPISIKRDQIIQRHSHSGLINDTNLHNNDYEQGEDNDLSPHATPSSNCSMRSTESINERPLSIMSNGTVKSSGSKSRFNFFSSSNNNGSKKQKRHSISLNFSKRSGSPSIISPTTPSFTSATMDFEELIRSGNTKKVTLTPNRLRSIEVKEEQTSWDRMSSIVPKLGRSATKKKTESSSPVPPIPPLPHFNRDTHHSNTIHANSNGNSPPLTPVSSVASRPSQRSRHSIIYEEKSDKSSLRSSSTHDDETRSQLSRNGSKLSSSSSLYSSRQSIQSSPEDDTVKTKNIAIERPSTMVVKRTSMGSRPPSFHEGTIDITTLLSNATITLPKDKKYGSKRLSTYKDEAFESVLQQPRSHPEMIYVIPASTIPSKKSLNRFQKICTTTDQSCQTNKQQEYTETDEDEEWFLDEEDNTEDEKNMTEWLLGNV